MRIIKRMDIFILKAFLQLFAGTFFICLFVFMMQFTWKHVDDLIGKGLSTAVLMKFFYYMALTLVPVALPLSILLASLITFGNFGEKLELLSMKAAGIPLLRILQPVILVVLMACYGSFYFQNRIGPDATMNLAALVHSMKQKSPEMQIAEGIFNNEIPGYNIFVEHKDQETGMLYGVMIYSTTEGYENAQIVLADSAMLQATEDQKHMKLTLYSGERFRNMDNQVNSMMKANIPYMRESFTREVDLITFDEGFNMIDPTLFAHNAATKDLSSIRTGIDSLNTRLDSVGHFIYASVQNNQMTHSLHTGRKDSAAIVKKAQKAVIPLDSVLNRLTDDQRKEVWRTATNTIHQMQNECEFRVMSTEEDNYMLRMHWVEYNKKFAISISCLLFFLIGAPLGAIIRKGGLGLPVVISVLIFIFYYIIDVSGAKMAKTGVWAVPFGMWLSSMVLLPVGLWLTYKANKDSVVFNIEGYRMFFQRLLGLREHRRLNRKEVIIVDPDYPTLHHRLEELASACDAYVGEAHLMRIPNYLNIFFHSKPDHTAAELSDQLEDIVKELHNSSDNRILGMINEFPILNPSAHTSPFHSNRANVIAGILLPVGVFFYLRICRYRFRLRRDMWMIRRTAEDINRKIEKITGIGDDTQTEQLPAEPIVWNADDNYKPTEINEQDIENERGNNTELD